MFPFIVFCYSTTPALTQCAERRHPKMALGRISLPLWRMARKRSLFTVGLEDDVGSCDFVWQNLSLAIFCPFVAASCQPLSSPSTHHLCGGIAASLPVSIGVMAGGIPCLHLQPQSPGLCLGPSTQRLLAPSSLLRPVSPPAPPGSLVPPALPWSVVDQPPPQDSTPPASPRPFRPNGSVRLLIPFGSIAVLCRSGSTAALRIPALVT